MRPTLKTQSTKPRRAVVARAVLAFSALAIAAAMGFALVGTAPVRADDDDEKGDAAATAKLAAAAMEKAVARGKEIWTNKDGLFKKSCASCHEDANKPNLSMKSRTLTYPGYHTRKKIILTLQQKLQDMIVTQSRGTAFDDKGTDIAALEAYVRSIK